MHEIRHLTFSGRFGQKRVYEEANRIHKANCEYHSSLDNLRIPTTQILRNYEEARTYLETHDRGWYDQMAVKYKDKTKTMWLVKIEYHV